MDESKEADCMQRWLGPELAASCSCIQCQRRAGSAARVPHENSTSAYREREALDDVQIDNETLLAGQPDYIGMWEFAARIRAILRQNKLPQGDARFPAAPGMPRPPRFSRFGGWEIDRRTRRLKAPDGSCVPLTKSEYALLAAFLDYPMVTLSREHLIQATRIHEDLHDRSIDVQILRLRRKLNLGHERLGLIRTVRGAGYMFMLPVEPVI
jgi:DNA-binding response OmpR family regulator